MKPVLKIMLVLIGIAALSLTEIGLMFWLGKKDVENFCREITPGIPVAQLANLAKKHDVRYALPGLRGHSGTYRLVVTTPRAFGRHTCIVQHDNVLVIAARYGTED